MFVTILHVQEKKGAPHSPSDSFAQCVEVLLLGSLSIFQDLWTLVQSSTAIYNSNWNVLTQT